uniref:Uncharacterized protein n=1 Tax=Arundo donax TaxID=35708 RepID=A0A0A9FY28_ARUDO
MPSSPLPFLLKTAAKVHTICSSWGSERIPEQLTMQIQTSCKT